MTELLNRSLSAGIIPSAFKSALIAPLREKPDLDSADLRSYRPIPDLMAVSKLREGIVFRQLYDYLSSANLLPHLQSAYLAPHSTETAVLKVPAVIIYALDDDLSVLALLYWSSAFDTNDHSIPLTRLRVSYGVGCALDWFQSDLTNNVVCLRRCSDQSAPTV